MSRVSREVVMKVAKLAALRLSEKDEEHFSKRLDSILEYVAILDEVSTEGVSEFHPSDRTEAYRADEVKNELSREDLLKNAPDQGDLGFRIPKVF